MNIVSGNSEVALCCTVLGEVNGRVRIRIRDKWEVDIFEDMIDSVKSDADGAQAQFAKFSEA